MKYCQECGKMNADAAFVVVKDENGTPYNLASYKIENNIKDHENYYFHKLFVYTIILMAQD